MPSINRLLIAVVCLCLAALLVGCPSQPVAHNDRAKAQAAARVGAWSRGSAKIQGVNLNDPIRPAADDEAIVISAAKNEWASFAVQVSELPKQPANRRIAYSFRIQSPQLQSESGNLAIEHFSAAQILPMPVDVNRAGFARHTGLAAAARARPLPRALLPMPMDKGVINLSAARDPADPTNPASRATGSRQPLLFWIDLHVPPETPPGEYATMCELLASDSRSPIATVPVKILIHDFLLPDERHLVMTSRLGWQDLKRLYPEQFETFRPQLINRSKPAYAAAIETLDSLVKLAQRHRTEVVVPRLQPIAKWPHGAPPEIDWADLDSILAPWLSGEAFGDKIPLNHWPLPAVDFLERFDRNSQLQYWSQAASHFDQREWLARSPVSLELSFPGRAGTAQALQMSADAAQILSAHSSVRVMVPLEDDQIHLASNDNKNFIDPKWTDRLLSASPGIVYASPLQSWPGGVPRPKHWLRTDVPGLVPYVGAGGDERDVRVWAWLAFLHDAGLIQWNSPLPRTSSPSEHADPNDLVWFYPGSWFGVDEPLATLQLKWLRRAQQDYEYLWLARQRGQAINAMLMARLIAKPVNIQPGQSPDPTYALLTGTSDPQAWNDAQRLLARVILLRQPGAERDDPVRANELGLQVLRWAEPQEQAVLMARTADWGIALGGDNLLNLRLGVDIYNASDASADQNQIRWGDADDGANAPAGWRVAPQPVKVPPLRPYHVDRFMMNAEFDLNKIDARDRRPSEITFVDGFSKQKSKLRFMLPVRASDRRRPGLKIDGKLDDWDLADAIHADAPLVQMLNRPALQKQELQQARHSSTVYTGWADEHFYIAFDLAGVQTGPVTQTRNFVDYQFRRAWGEDLAEMLIQPIFADNTLGPVLHVVCKPAGHWIERKRNRRQTHEPWQPFEGAAIRYTATMNGAGDWAGEVAIPWKAITDKNRGVPKMLRFNFVQHVHATGESASWAGPIDFGRDDSFMGLLYIRESTDPGMAGP